MRFLSRHTARPVLTFIVLICSAWVHLLHAQEIIMPERWQKALTHTRSIFRQDTLTIRIFGDMMMHSRQIENARTGKDSFDFSPCFEHIRACISDADIAVANMEFTLAGKPYTGYPCFSAPDDFAFHLADCGFDVFLAANNHIFDKGTGGAERTLEIYRRMEDERGIRFTGLAGNEEESERTNPLIITRKGIKIAFINLTYGTNLGLETLWPRTFRISSTSEIRKAMSRAEEADADFTIALPHWGTEYVLQHSAGQEKAAIMLAENGADMIIGSHPHVVQDMQTLEIRGADGREVPVAYSLGNAISNMSAPDTQLELMATIRIIRESNGDIKVLPLELTYLWCSRPGGYKDHYTVLPVKDFIGTRASWTGPWEYDKMMDTYERVRRKTGIE